jgi:hypothetical protein
MARHRLGERGDLLVAPDEVRERGWQVSREGVGAAQRREGGRQALGAELPDVFEVDEVPQPVQPEVDETEIGR